MIFSILVNFGCFWRFSTWGGQNFFREWVGPSCLAGETAVEWIYHGFGMIPTCSGPVPGVNVWKTVDFAGGDIDVIWSGFEDGGWD